MALSDQELIAALNYLGRPVQVALAGGPGPEAGPGSLPSSPAAGSGVAPGGGPAPAPAAAPPASFTPSEPLLFEPSSLLDLPPGSELIPQQRRALELLGFLPDAAAGGEAALGGGSGPTSDTGSAFRNADPQRSNITQILDVVGKGGKALQDIIDRFPTPSPSHAMDPDTRQAFEMQRAGERGDFTGALPDVQSPDFTNMQRFGEFGELVPGEAAPDFTNMLEFGEFGELGPTAGGLPTTIAGAAERVPGVLANLGESGAALSAAGSLGGAALGFVNSLSNALNAKSDFDRVMGGNAMALYAAAPFTGGATALAAGIMQGIDAIVAGITGADIGQHLGFSPSPEWLQFAPNLAENIGTTNTSLVTLANDIAMATTPQQLAAAAQKYRQTIGGFAGGFGQGAQPYDLPTPPGATGTEHEGRISVNYGEIMPTVNEFFQARLRFLENPTAENDAVQQAAMAKIQPGFTEFEWKYFPARVDWAEEDRKLREQVGLPADYGSYIESSGA